MFNMSMAGKDVWNEKTYTVGEVDSGNTGQFDFAKVLVEVEQTDGELAVVGMERCTIFATALAVDETLDVHERVDQYPQGRDVRS